MSDSPPAIGGTVPLGGDSPRPAGPTIAPVEHMGGHHLGQPAGVVPPPGPPPNMAGAHMIPPGQADPISREIDLPSGGLYYPQGQRRATVYPMRGELEMAIAGTPEESPERVRAIRNAVEACSRIPGLPFRELLLFDFAAISMHVMALSAGTDEVGVRPGCGKGGCPLKHKTITLTTLPCTFLRRAEAGAGAAAPAPEEDLDPMILAAMEIERREAADAGDDGEPAGPVFRDVPPDELREPFVAILPSGVRVQWRYHRVKDLEAAEDFAMQTGDTGTGIAAALGGYLSARQIVAIDGQEVGTVQALRWWQKALSPDLKEFRRQVNAREFGYNMAPEFRCPRSECRKKVRVALPNDGSLFRRRG